MAQRYLKFFNAASDIWKHTNDIVSDTIDGGDPTVYVDVASGPGEPAGTILNRYRNIRKGYVTDGADAMLELAKGRFSEMDSTIQEKTEFVRMDLNDFSPLSGEKHNVDLMTAQFALMFTSDFSGCLKEIDRVLAPGGYLIGTVWEQFDVLTLTRETMTEVLGRTPPPPPIDPLSLKERTYVDEEMRAVGFEFGARHNESRRCVFDMGSVEHDDEAFLALLIPVTPTLKDLETNGTIPDATNKAATILRQVAERNGNVVDGNLRLEGTYRYFVAQKPTGDSSF